MAWYEDVEVDPSFFLLYHDERLPKQLGVFVKEEGIWRAPLDEIHEELVELLLRHDVPIVDKESLPPGRENQIDVHLRELEKLELSSDECHRRIKAFCEELSVTRKQEREAGKPRAFSVRKRDRTSDR
jgi:hypothetical protein